MVFSSVDFLFLFLPLVLALYFGLGGRAANPVLLAASLLFYAVGEGWFLGVMLVSVALNWAAGLGIAANRGPRRRWWLAGGVAANLLLLGYFKYLGFLVADVLGLPAPEGSFAAGIHLPLGISFFTFQAISYLVDVHRGEVAPERSPFLLGTYIAMFPQLIAGPIVRFRSVAAALHARTVTPRHLYYGFAFFGAGLAAKVLIADGVAPVADAIFAEDPDLLRADAAALGVGAYTLQIYFDFLGYSGMAIGLGHLLGFRFPRNFAYPYTARSMTEFWRRWHISLSTWFRDYVYIPLGGNRAGAARTYLNLSIVFLLTGLWHGAAWTFVLWGAWHGAFLVIERIGLGGLLARAPAALAHAYLLLAVMAGWVLFRAETLAHAAGLFEAFGQWHGTVPAAAHLTNEALLTLALGALLAGPRVQDRLSRWIEMPRYGDWPERLSPARTTAGLILFSGLIALSMVKILSGSYSPFIYFRF